MSWMPETNTDEYELSFREAMIEHRMAMAEYMFLVLLDDQPSDTTETSPRSTYPVPQFPNR